jgi:hypothetical protein
MTRWSAITRNRGRRSPLAYGSRSTTAAENNLNRLIHHERGRYSAKPGLRSWPGDRPGGYLLTARVLSRHEGGASLAWASVWNAGTCRPAPGGGQWCSDGLQPRRGREVVPKRPIALALSAARAVRRTADRPVARSRRGRSASRSRARPRRAAGGSPRRTRTPQVTTQARPLGRGRRHHHRARGTLVRTCAYLMRTPSGTRWAQLPPEVRASYFLAGAPGNRTDSGGGGSGIPVGPSA